MIKKFECVNFRNVNTKPLEFERINILIGSNNSGKSNFIKALSFAAGMINNSKDEVTGFLSELKRNGWYFVLNKSAKIPELKFKWQFKIEKDRLVEYSLCANIGVKREDNYIKEESLDGVEVQQAYSEPYNYFRCHVPKIGEGYFSTAGFRKKKNRRRCISVNKYESVFLQMNNLFFNNMDIFSDTFVTDGAHKVVESLNNYFKSFYAYSCTAFDVRAIKEMRDEQNSGKQLQKDGSNFVNVFINAMDEDDEFKHKYLKALRKLLSGCDDLRIMHAGGKVWMELKINDYWFPLSEVSDGTIHLLLLLMMLYLPESSGISMLAIDEPEMNLHPAWQELMAREVLNCKSFKQCFISTHSPEFLDAFTDDFLDNKVAVFVFDPSSRTKIRKLSRDELKDDLKEWTLGDLYRVGDPLIGGWPQ